MGLLALTEYCIEAYREHTFKNGNPYRTHDVDLLLDLFYSDWWYEIIVGYPGMAYHDDFVPPPKVYQLPPGRKPL